MRVLGVCRISKEREESTAIVRQMAAIEAWAIGNGHEIVGWAADEGISGTVDPWARPELGKWLGAPGKPQPESFHDWDAIAVWRLDRLSRRVIPLRQALDFVTESGKTVISTTEGFDPATPMGRIFITILAALAEGELEAIKERNRNTAQHLIRTGGDRGSLPPYGYARDGLGGLVHDAETIVELNRVVDRLLEGHSVNSVRLWANEEGILTPKDAHWRAVGKFPRVKDGKAQEPYKWTVSTFRRTLSSRALLGEAQTVGPDGERRTVLTAEGQPVIRAQPILSVDRFKALQTALDGRTREVKKRRGASPMLGVAIRSGSTTSALRPPRPRAAASRPLSRFGASGSTWRLVRPSSRFLATWPSHVGCSFRARTTLRNWKR
jgi:DNA invertase Pin-like site-specific DNA recombinase